MVHAELQIQPGGGAKIRPFLLKKKIINRIILTRLQALIYILVVVNKEKRQRLTRIMITSNDLKIPGIRKSKY